MHNSGHVTADACVTGQFEQHLRAVLDLPLGDVPLRTPAAAMVNVVGVGGPPTRVAPEPRSRLATGMTVDPAAKVHLYAKTPRPERKIGHVTVCDDDADRGLARATAVAPALDGRDPAPQ